MNAASETTPEKQDEPGPDEQRYARYIVQEEMAFVSRCQTGRILYPCKCSTTCSYLPIVQEKWKAYNTLYDEYQLIYDQFFHHYLRKIPNKGRQAPPKESWALKLMAEETSKNSSNKSNAGADTNPNNDAKPGDTRPLTESKRAMSQLLQTSTIVNRAVADTARSFVMKTGGAVRQAVEERKAMHEKQDRKKKTLKEKADKKKKAVKEKDDKKDGGKTEKDSIIRKILKRLKLVKDKETPKTRLEKLTEDFEYWLGDKTEETLARMRNLAVINLDHDRWQNIPYSILSWTLRYIFGRHHCICLHCDFMEQSILIHKATIHLYTEYCDVYRRYLGLWYADKIVRVMGEEDGGQEAEMVVTVMPEYHQEVKTVKQELQWLSEVEQYYAVDVPDW